MAGLPYEKRRRRMAELADKVEILEPEVGGTGLYFTGSLVPALPV